MEMSACWVCSEGREGDGVKLPLIVMSFITRWLQRQLRELESNTERHVEAQMPPKNKVAMLPLPRRFGPQWLVFYSAR